MISTLNLSSQHHTRRFWSTRTFSRALSYANPRFDDLAEQQLTATDEAKRKAILFEMQTILVLSVPVIPLYYPCPGHKPHSRLDPTGLCLDKIFSQHL